jgi:ribulose kinase
MSPSDASPTLPREPVRRTQRAPFAAGGCHPRRARTQADLTGRALFAAVAPRLERAHRELLQELGEQRAERHGPRGRRYQAERWRKLQDAYRTLTRVRAYAETIGAVPTP